MTTIKRLSLFAAAVMLMAALAGCGGQAEAPSSSLTQEESSSTTENTALSQETAAEEIPSPSPEAADEAEAEDLPADSVQPEDPPSGETSSSPEDTDQQAFTSMALNLSKGTLYIRTGEAFSLTRHDGTAVSYEIVDDTLSFDSSHTDEVVLTLPEGGSYKELRLTVGDGHVYGEGQLTLETLAVTVSRGEATLDALSVSDESTVSVDQGHALLTGDLGSSITASCKEGQLSLSLSRAREDYNYALELSDGNVQLGADHYYRDSDTLDIDNSADRSASLHCSRGSISIGFDGSSAESHGHQQEKKRK